MYSLIYHYSEAFTYNCVTLHLIIVGGLVLNHVLNSLEMSSARSRVSGFIANQVS